MSKTHAGGPNTAAGKARSAQNARRHGLACCAALDPALAPEIERLALAFAGADADPVRLYHARRMAEAHVDIRRVQLARRELLQRPFSPPRPPSTRALIFVWRRLRAGRAPDAFTARIVRRLRPPEPAPWEVAARRLRQLAALERYERRAHSRRRTALRAMDAAPGAFLAERTFTPREPAAASAGVRAGEPTRRRDPRLARRKADTSSRTNLAERTGAVGSGPPRPPAPAWMANPPRCDVRTQAASDGPAQADASARVNEPAAPGDDAVRNRVLDLAWDGYSYEHIARRLHISMEELLRDYTSELQCAADLMQVDVSRAVYAKACAGSVPAAIYLSETFLGWTDRGPPPRAPPPPALDAAAKQQLMKRVMALFDCCSPVRADPK